MVEPRNRGVSGIDGDLCKARRGRVALYRCRLAHRGRPRIMTLSQGLSDYLAVRRSLGFDLSFEGVLRVFPRFADREGTDHITVDLFLRWTRSIKNGIAQETKNKLSTGGASSLRLVKTTILTSAGTPERFYGPDPTCCSLEPSTLPRQFPW